MSSQIVLKSLKGGYGPPIEIQFTLDEEDLILSNCDARGPIYPSIYASVVLSFYSHAHILTYAHTYVHSLPNHVRRQ